MPLLDHFRPPLAPVRRWESFFRAWAVSLDAELNASLPKRFFAECLCRPERHVEREVADVDPQANGWPGFPAPDVFGTKSGGGPRFRFGTEMAVEVRDRERDHNVAGIVEFVSPDSKDELDSRFALVSKVIAHLSRGIGVLVVDIVTSHADNLHRLWADMTDGPFALESPNGDAPIYAISYRPRMDGGTPVLDVWARALAVGQSLPELPLALKGYGCVAVDLDATYAEARQRSGLA